MKDFVTYCYQQFSSQLYSIMMLKNFPKYERQFNPTKLNEERMLNDTSFDRSWKSLENEEF